MKFSEKVSLEVAMADFERMEDAAEIDVDGMSAKERDDYEETKRKFIRLIQIGQMSVGDDGLPSIYIGHQDLEWLKFESFGSTVLNAQGRVRENDPSLKNRAMIAEATQIAAPVLSRCVSIKKMLLATEVLNFFC